MNINPICGFKPIFKGNNIKTIKKYKTEIPNKTEFFKTKDSDEFTIYKKNMQAAKQYAQYLQNQAHLLKEEGEELYDYYTDIINNIDDKKYNSNISTLFDKKSKSWYVKTLGIDEKPTSWIIYNKKENSMVIGNMLHRKPTIYNFNNGRINGITQERTLQTGEINITYTSDNNKDYTISLPDFSCKFTDNQLVSVTELKPIEDKFGCVYSYKEHKYTYQN